MATILDPSTLSDTTRKVKEIDKAEVRRENCFVIWQSKAIFRKQCLKAESM